MSRKFCSLDLKISSVGANVHSAGIMFQSLGPVTMKELSYADIFDLFLGSVGREAFIPNLSLWWHWTLMELGAMPFNNFHMYMRMYLSLLRWRDISFRDAIRSQ